MENTTETTSPQPRRRRIFARLAVIGGTIAGACGIAAAPALAVTSPLPNAGSVATSLADTAGGQLVSTAVVVLPVIIGVLVIFWAINYVMGKFNFRKAKVH